MKSLKLAQDAVVEIKAGSLYRRIWYQGVPVTMDAGDWPQVDTGPHYVAEWTDSERDEEADQRGVSD